MSDVRAVWTTQVEAWNRGDLDGFMAGYWKSPDLVFFSNGTETRGWQATLDRYRARYQAEGKQMGTLDFPELDIVTLGPESAMARGRWRLKMPDGTDVERDDIGHLSKAARRLAHRARSFVGREQLNRRGGHLFMPAINPAFVTTALELPGYRAVKNFGVVRGIVVRSRSIIGTFGATLQTLVGGNITLYTQLCERAREDAFGLMLEHAAALGANALISVRYDANEVAPGVTEVLAYGTAVTVEAAQPS